MAQAITKMETIQAVDRALTILETISRANTISLNEINETLKINKASLSRLMYTLTENGYIQKNEKTGEYSLTLKTYEVGINAVQNLDKLSLINSTLADLNRQCGRVSQFSIEDGNQLLCLQSIGQQQTSFSIYTNVGQRSSLFATSAGKAILSTCSNDEIIDKWNNADIKPLTEHTITDLHQFLQEISRIRQRAYALDIEENEYGTFCIGTPVLDHTGKAIGAISISEKHLNDDEEAALAKILIPAAKRLSELLGYIGG